MSQATERNTEFLQSVSRSASSTGEAQAFTADMYGDRLKLRLKEMSIEKLEVYQGRLARFPDKENKLVNRIGVALTREIKDRQAHREKAFAAADAHMKNALEALGNNRHIDAGAHIQHFVEALTPLNSGSADIDSAAAEIYKDHFKQQLPKMKPKELKALEAGAAAYLVFLVDLKDAVVEMIGNEVRVTLAERQQVSKQPSPAQ